MVLLYVFDHEMLMRGIIENVKSLIWTRRYWSCGDFKLLVPFTERNVDLLKKDRLILKRGDDEAAEIRYVNIRKNLQGSEEIEVQGRFITGWIGKRIIRHQIVTNDNTQNILTRIVAENITDAAAAPRRIPNVYIEGVPDLGSGVIDYASEPFINALLGCENAAKAAKLGFRIWTDVKQRRHYFRVYKGCDLTSDQAVNAPCIFSQEFDNILAQEYTNSIENFRTTAYVGGEDIPGGAARQVVEAGSAAAGLERDEVFINATDLTQTYKDSAGNDVTMTLPQYINVLTQRGNAELEHFAETLGFSSKVNTHSNLKYKADYDLGDRVTCVNRRWGLKINVRITEIAEIYQENIDEIDITFGESLPALIDVLRQII